jgi:hypothetical protein
MPANLAARQWGENIWTGRGYDPRQVRYLAQKIMDGWMNSPGHRDNILTPGYTHLGVGVMAKNQAVNATQVFIGIAGDAPPNGQKSPDHSRSAGVGACVSAVAGRVSPFFFAA